ncbi:MAG TPA: phospholipid carrier-dependent glycosyltransferase [Archaeoglobaceae archaeon]|nr:phospholipid carrier-dependent glycosyltransferase [Archaeoglobaceae archaeon]
MRKLKIAFTIVAIITILGFIFRIAGINFGLPQVFHPDEPFIVERANTMALTGDMNPHFFIYPSLLIYIYCLLFKIEHILLDEVTRSIIYVTARSFNALLGALMVPLTYMLGSKLYSKKLGSYHLLSWHLRPLQSRTHIMQPLIYLSPFLYFLLFYLLSELLVREAKGPTYCQDV